MLQFTGLQRVGHDLVTKQQQQKFMVSPFQSYLPNLRSFSHRVWHEKLKIIAKLLEILINLLLTQHRLVLWPTR